MVKIIKRVVKAVIPKNDPELPYLMREYYRYRNALLGRVKNAVRPIIKDRTIPVYAQQKWMIDQKLNRFLSNLPFHPMPFHRQSVWLELREEAFYLHFKTGEGNVTCKIKTPKKFYKILKEASGPNNTKLRQIELVEDPVRKKIRVYCVLGLEAPEPYKPAGWVGVDMGWNHLAVSAFYNPKTRKASNVTYHGKGWKAKILILNNLIRQHQVTGKVVKVWRHRRANVTRNAVGEVAKEIVKKAKGLGAGVKIERLTFQSHTKQWLIPRYKLKMAIKNLCEREGVPFREVPAQYTSQMCSRCKNKKTMKYAISQTENEKNAEKLFHELIKTQRNGKHFQCRDCNYQAESDANSAINVAKA